MLYDAAFRRKDRSFIEGSGVPHGSVDWTLDDRTTHEIVEKIEIPEGAKPLDVVKIQTVDKEVSLMAAAFGITGDVDV